MGRRRSQVKATQKKLLQLRSQREKRALDPPYDCTGCEGFTCVQVTVREATYIFKCQDCKRIEIVPMVDNFDLIDHYNLISDKWLAERKGRNPDSPLEYEFFVDPKQDRLKIYELQRVTYGVVQLYTYSGGEVLPISLKEAIELPKEAPDRSVVDWSEVISKIIDSGQYYSAREVCEQLAGGEVKAFRTKSVLDKAVEQGILARFWHEKKYIYGKPIE